MVISTSFSYGRNGSDIMGLSFMHRVKDRRTDGPAVQTPRARARNEHLQIKCAGQGQQRWVQSGVANVVRGPVRRSTRSRLGDKVKKLAHAPEFFVAGVDQFLGALVRKGEQLAFENVAKELCGAFVIVVRTAFGFGNNFVNDAEFHQVFGDDLHRNGSGFGFGGVAPDDSGTTFGRDHGIEPVLQNVHAVAYGDGKGAARASFTGDCGDDGHGQARHFAQIAGDGFTLAALFGIDAWICAWRVDEREDGPAEFCGELHHAKSLAIALGLGLSKITGDALLDVSSLLMADDGDGTPAEFGESGGEGSVVAEVAITVKLDKIRKHELHPIQGVRSLGVAGYLCALPRAYVSVEFLV